MIRFFALLALGFLMTACTPVVRVRTLPASIQSVHVPMAINRSAEPGLSENVTKAVQREILADGRLDLTSARNADAIIELTIQNFRVETQQLSGDDFPSNQIYVMETSMRIRENVPGRPTIGGRRVVNTRSGFSQDTRFTSFSPEADDKEELYDSAARGILFELLTGDFTEATLTNVGRDSEENTENASD